MGAAARDLPGGWVDLEVPPGAIPGARLSARVPADAAAYGAAAGRLVRFTVPEGAAEGGVVRVPLPAPPRDASSVAAMTAEGGSMAGALGRAWDWARARASLLGQRRHQRRGRAEQGGGREGQRQRQRQRQGQAARPARRQRLGVLGAVAAVLVLYHLLSVSAWRWASVTGTSSAAGLGARAGAERFAVVTAVPAGRGGDTDALRAVAVAKRYAAARGYRFYPYELSLNWTAGAQMFWPWAKVPLLMDAMRRAEREKSPPVQYLLWVDPSALLVDPSRALEELVDELGSGAAVLAATQHAAPAVWEGRWWRRRRERDPLSGSAGCPPAWARQCDRPEVSAAALAAAVPAREEAEAPEPEPASKKGKKRKKKKQAEPDDAPRKSTFDGDRKGTLVRSTRSRADDIRALGADYTDARCVDLERVVRSDVQCLPNTAVLFLRVGEPARRVLTAWLGATGDDRCRKVRWQAWGQVVPLVGFDATCFAEVAVPGFGGHPHGAAAEIAAIDEYDRGLVKLTSADVLGTSAAYPALECDHPVLDSCWERRQARHALDMTLRQIAAYLPPWPLPRSWRKALRLAPRPPLAIFDHSPRKRWLQDELEGRMDVSLKELDKIARQVRFIKAAKGAECPWPCGKYRLGQA